MNEKQVIPPSQNSLQFLENSLQCIVQNQGAVEPVYRFLAAHQNELNVELLNELPTLVSVLLSYNVGNEESVVGLLCIFGSLLLQFPLGTPEINIELAITIYKQALQVITREDMPMKWATVMTNLAIAYFYRIRGDRAQNLEDAIDTYGEALQVMTREAMPVEWSAAMMSLANAYFYRIRGERTQNLEDAIDAYKQSLQVRTREAMPFDWATVMMNLANPYFYRKGDRAQNLEDAIDVCKQALQVMTREAMPVYWAITMNNLALAYLKRIRGDRAQNLEEAIEA